MTPRSTVLLSSCFAGVLGGCAQVLGLGDFVDGSSTATATGAGGEGQGGAGGAGSVTSGTGGGGGTGGDGGATACEPGAEMPCYGGPPGTENVGICAPGLEVCAGDGSGFGPCEGEVTPAPENCAAADDEDCNGTAVTVCSGALGWTIPVAPGGSAGINDVVVATDGSTYVTGTFTGPLDFGGATDPLTADASIPNAYLLKIDAQGQPEWARGYGDAGNYQYGLALAAASDGSVVLGGRFLGTIDFGGGPLTASGEDLFVARIRPDGAADWSQWIDLGSYAWDIDIAIDASDSTYVLSDFGASAIVGALSGTSAGDNDVVVVKLTPGGLPAWLRTFGGAGLDQAASISASADGRIVIAGRFTDPLTFGGATLASTGATDWFVARLDTDGAHLASFGFGHAAAEGAIRVAMGAADEVFVAAEAQGATTLQGNSMVSQGRDLLLARLDGALVYEAHGKYGMAGDQRVAALAVDPVGHLLISGAFDGVLDLDQSPWTASAQDYFTAKLAFSAAAPEILWAFSYPRPLDQSGLGVAPHPAGGAIVAASYAGSIILQAGEVINATSTRDLVIARRGL